MGVKLKKQTERDLLLRIVLSVDSAIDWEKTYPEIMEHDDKVAEYKRTHDATKLVYIEGDQPSLFVFDHPKRVDVGRKIRGLYARQQVSSKEQIDLFTEIWDKAFLGIEEGHDSGPLVSPNRINGRITDEYFQSLEDSGVFSEAAFAFMQAADRSSDNALDKKK